MACSNTSGSPCTYVQGEPQTGIHYLDRSLAQQNSDFHTFSFANSESVTKLFLRLMRAI